MLWMKVTEKKKAAEQDGVWNECRLERKKKRRKEQ
jgi:hypothetical protein